MLLYVVICGACYHMLCHRAGARRTLLFMLRHRAGARHTLLFMLCHRAGAYYTLYTLRHRAIDVIIHVVSS